MATGGVFQIISCCGGQKLPAGSTNLDSVSDGNANNTITSDMIAEASDVMLTAVDVPPTQKNLEIARLHAQIEKTHAEYNKLNALHYFLLFLEHGHLEEADKYVADVMELYLNAGNAIITVEEIREKARNNLAVYEMFFKRGIKPQVGHYQYFGNTPAGIDLFMKYTDRKALDKYLAEIHSDGSVKNCDWFIRGYSVESIKHLMEHYPHCLRYNNVFCREFKYAPKATSTEMLELFNRFYGPDALGDLLRAQNCA